MVSQVLTRISVPASRSDWYRANVVDMEFVPPPRTIQALHNEHIYMSNLLDSLEEQVALIATGRDADFHLLLDIIDYMQSFPERFHHPKEDLIFQRMALRDEHSVLDVQAMMAEHKVIEKLTRRLAASIDEVHVLRGIFGSHVGNVLRRLRRLARFYGSDPTFIACSATYPSKDCVEASSARSSVSIAISWSSFALAPLRVRS